MIGFLTLLVNMALVITAVSILTYCIKKIKRTTKSS